MTKRRLKENHLLGCQVNRSGEEYCFSRGGGASQSSRGPRVRSPSVELYFFTHDVSSLSRAVVAAKVVEQWHSVFAFKVRIPGRTWVFWFRIAVYLFLLGIGLSLRMSNPKVHTPSSSSL